MKKDEFPFCTWKDLTQKEVINKKDGKRLGYVKNAGVDPLCGSITSIIVPCGSGLFPSKEDALIPWSDIEKIGEDVILVHYSKTSCKEK